MFSATIAIEKATMQEIGQNAAKDEAGVNLDAEENDFRLMNAYSDDQLEELNASMIMMAHIQPTDNKSDAEPTYDAEVISEFLKARDESLKIKNETGSFKKDFKVREDKYLDDIVMLEEKLKYHERVFFKMSHSLQTIHMLSTKPNSFYDPNMETGLGYQNLECIKKAMKAQPKMYNGKHLKYAGLKVNLPDSKETLEDAEKNRLKMKDKMIPLDYHKLNKLYESFVPQKEISAEQTYLSSPSTSNVTPESSPQKEVCPISKSLHKCTQIIKQEITTEVQEMLENFESMKSKVDEQSQQQEIYQKEIDQLLEVALEREVRDCVMISVEHKESEMLMNEMEKISNDCKDIQANLLKRIKILENDFQRSQAQSIDFKLQMQHQKEKDVGDISWKSKIAKLNGEKVSLTIQIESLVQEREIKKMEYQKLFNSIKTTRVKHQREVNELVENVNQKTYAYADVHFKNQDLFMKISELKAKLKTIKKGKNVNLKFDKSETLEKLICVTLMNKNKDLKSKMVSKVEVKKDKSKPVTSLSSSSSVSRQESKDSNLKKRVLLHTKSKSTSKYFKKSQSSVSLVSNKCDKLNSNVSESKTNVLNVKNVNAVNDGSNLVYVSCGKDVFMISYDKCVDHYALSANSRVKRALFIDEIK
ncbi:hypothetical protein Tco_0926990 [Tanacetum coccineum]|uniref:Uncharacterized protein n=1 Tax=Tanacetum coccineum TaxID=301880 RepID=A0ABQ5DE81_9ASTR